MKKKPRMPMGRLMTPQIIKSHSQPCWSRQHVGFWVECQKGDQESTWLLSGSLNVPRTIQSTNVSKGLFFWNIRGLRLTYAMSHLPTQVRIRSGLKKAAKHPRCRGSTVEESDSLGTFAPGVPRGDKMNNDGEEGSLAQAHQKSNGVELRHGSYGCGAKGEDGPEDFQGRD